MALGWLSSSAQSKNTTSQLWQASGWVCSPLLQTTSQPADTRSTMNPSNLSVLQGWSLLQWKSAGGVVGWRSSAQALRGHGLPSACLLLTQGLHSLVYQALLW